MESLRVDDERVPYPDSTHDVVKLLREFGFAVEFIEPADDRRYVGHKAFELWMPVLAFTVDVLSNFSAGILVELVKAYIEPYYGETPDKAQELESGNEVEEAQVVGGTGILHVDWRVTTANGHEEQFVANGSADEVLKSLGRFEKHVRRL